MKKKEEIALEAITQHVHTIHMDWMSNLVADSIIKVLM